MGFTFGKSMGCPGGYDDGFTLSMIWRTLASALQPHHENTTATSTTSSGGGTNTQVQRARSNESMVTTVSRAGAGSCRCYCPPGQVGVLVPTHSLCLPNLICCFCQGFGRCVNASSASSCRDSSLIGAPALFCPNIGVVHQCISPADSDVDICNRTEMQQWQKGHGVANCTQTRRCALEPAAKMLATAACVCTPTKWSGCEWNFEPCPWNSPYFPPDNA
jgi:hypothetical protein